MDSGGGLEREGEQRRQLGLPVRGQMELQPHGGLSRWGGKAEAQNPMTGSSGWAIVPCRTKTGSHGSPGPQSPDSGC